MINCVEDKGNIFAQPIWKVFSMFSENKVFFPFYFAVCQTEEIKKSKNVNGGGRDRFWWW